ncbi:hypothetical protein FNU76_03550 [Chitinimonas arctica]|uniref:Uncharacterized protein n=1 Tax=Chitinimonas arctica TaxID=2594795 RepID=A0A516SBH5_9NEIS|nr:hypothetical protein [Chitinimonas arctica]QDQ25502.1 hypothetical protein FNU76_03550 [Chitinimonas arctica]
MNNPSESTTRYNAGKTDGIDPKPGDQQVMPAPGEPAPVLGPKYPLGEPAYTRPANDPTQDGAMAAVARQEVDRSTQAVKQDAQQFLAYSQAISMVTSDVIQRYFAIIERNTQRYCQAVNAYLDAFREELTSTGRAFEEGDTATRKAAELPYSQRSRTDGARTDTRLQNQRA